MSQVYPTILVVDDHADIRGVIREFLAPLGYRILEASGGSDALRVLNQSDVDVVLTDLVMPDSDGIETLMEIRRRHPAVKTIAMSGAFSGQFLKVARLLGAEATITKPLNSRLLRLTILQVLAGEGWIEGPDRAH